MTFALRLPVADGENVSETMHEAPTASWFGFVGHVDVWAKSDALAPDTTIPEIVSAAVPEFVRVTDFAELVDPTV